MIDLKVLSAAATAGAAVLGFLYREYKNRNKSIDKHNDKQDEEISGVKDRTLVLETKMNTTEPAVTELRLNQQRDGIRLATTEAGVNQIRGDVTEIKQMITTKLDKIPELTTALNSFGELCKTFVPRHEIEARFAALERENDKEREKE